LLGVAGMIINSYLLWIIPENSLRLAPVSKWHEHTHLNQAKMRQAHIKTTIENGVVKPSLEPSCGVLENQSPTHLRPTPTAAPNFGSFTEHRDHLARRGHDAWGWVILIIDVFWRFLMFYSFPLFWMWSFWESMIIFYMQSMSPAKNHDIPCWLEKHTFRTTT
jgi:hypothetical protein